MSLCILKKAENIFYDLSPAFAGAEIDIDTFVERFNAQVMDGEGSYASDIAAETSVFNEQEVLELAEKWNDTIFSEAKTAVERWLKKGISLNTTLARIAMETADDMFTVSGNYCVVGMYGDIHTILSEDELEEIRENPQDFAIVDIQFKNA